MNDKMLRNKINKIREALTVITEQINDIYYENSIENDITLIGEQK